MKDKVVSQKVTTKEHRNGEIEELTTTVYRKPDGRLYTQEATLTTTIIPGKQVTTTTTKKKNSKDDDDDDDDDDYVNNNATHVHNTLQHNANNGSSMEEIITITTYTRADGSQYMEEEREIITQPPNTKPLKRITSSSSSSFKKIKKQSPQKTTKRISKADDVPNSHTATTTTMTTTTTSVLDSNPVKRISKAVTNPPSNSCFDSNPVKRISKAAAGDFTNDTDRKKTLRRGSSFDKTHGRTSSFDKKPLRRVSSFDKATTNNITAKTKKQNDGRHSSFDNKKGLTPSTSTTEKKTKHNKEDSNSSLDLNESLGLLDLQQTNDEEEEDRKKTAPLRKGKRPSTIKNNYHQSAGVLNVTPPTTSTKPKIQHNLNKSFGSIQCAPTAAGWSMVAPGGAPKPQKIIKIIQKPGGNTEEIITTTYRQPGGKTIVKEEIKRARNKKPSESHSSLNASLNILDLDRASSPNRSTTTLNDDDDDMITRSPGNPFENSSNNSKKALRRKLKSTSNLAVPTLTSPVEKNIPLKGKKTMRGHKSFSSLNHPSPNLSQKEELHQSLGSINISKTLRPPRKYKEKRDDDWVDVSTETISVTRPNGKIEHITTYTYTRSDGIVSKERISEMEGEEDDDDDESF